MSGTLLVLIAPPAVAAVAAAVLRARPRTVYWTVCSLLTAIMAPAFYLASAASSPSPSTPSAGAFIFVADSDGYDLRRRAVLVRVGPGRLTTIDHVCSLVPLGNRGVRLQCIRRVDYWSEHRSTRAMIGREPSNPRLQRPGSAGSLSAAATVATARCFAAAEPPSR